MKNTMGIINFCAEPKMLYELIETRCPASIPFGGRYRLIDFVLSNMVNSGIQNVGIFTHGKYRSLLDHVGGGQEWDLDRKRGGGLFIFPPAVSSDNQGDVQNLYEHLDYFYKSKQEYVIISGSLMVYNFNYKEAIKFHLEKEADITVMYKGWGQFNDDTPHWLLDIENDGQVIRLSKGVGKINKLKVCMDTFIMKKAFLIELIQKCIEQKKYSLIEDGIIPCIKQKKIFGFPFRGYLAFINSINSYYQHSMELLKPGIRKELFSQNNQIYTKTKNEPPTKYLGNCEVSNSMIANGCLIEGKVENSILFRGVKVHKGAVVRNSIIMQRCEIGTDVVVKNAILDKEVRISDGRTVKGEHIPIVIGKRKVI